MATNATKKRSVVRTTKTQQPTQVTEKQENKSNEVEVTENNIVERTKKNFDPTDGILCRSVTVGRLWLEGRRSGELYNWVAYGDEIEVEYRDLVALIRSKSSYIYNPYFIIDDEDFLAEFPEVLKFYNDQYKKADLIEILQMPVKQMVATIESLPKGANKTLRSLASTMVSNGSIDSVQRIRALDEVFGTELHLLSSLIQ